MNCATEGGGGGLEGLGAGGQPKWGIKPRGGGSKWFDNTM